MPILAPSKQHFYSEQSSLSMDQSARICRLKAHSATVAYLGVLPWQQSLGDKQSFKIADKQSGFNLSDCSSADALLHSLSEMQLLCLEI
jgi:hypothetical protein